MPNEHEEATQNRLGGIALNALEVGAFKKIIQKYHDATDPSSKDVWSQERRASAQAVISLLEALLNREAKYNLPAAIAIVKRAYPALEIGVGRERAKKKPALKPAPGSIAEHLLAVESPQALKKLLKELSQEANC